MDEEMLYYIASVDASIPDEPEGAYFSLLREAALAWLDEHGRQDPYGDEGCTIIFDVYLDWRDKLREGGNEHEEG